MTLALSNVREPESEGKPQKSLNEKQQVSGYIHALKNEFVIHALNCIFNLNIFSLVFLFILILNFHFLLVQENQDLLIKCISQDLGFSGGKPVAACVIYKCLLHWRSFEVERTTVFDRIIQTIASAVEVTLTLIGYLYNIHDIVLLQYINF